MGIKVQDVIAIDCETSGINLNANRCLNDRSVAHGYQAVSWGIVITDTETFKVKDELHVMIKWNGESKWDAKAEAIHGMSKEYLEKHGMDEEDAVVEIVEFLMKHLDITKPLYCLGHNVVSFDIPFLKALFTKYELNDIKFAHRHLDTFSLSMGTVKEYDSDTLFRRVGLKDRESHNALEDAKNALEVYRRINKAWTQMLAKS
jgi:DNA polymerase III alpha subunit (gram-positive type)